MKATEQKKTKIEKHSFQDREFDIFLTISCQFLSIPDDS